MSAEITSVALVLGLAGLAAAAAPSRAESLALARVALSKALVRFDASAAETVKTDADGRLLEWRDANGGAWKARPFAANALFDVKEAPRLVGEQIAGRPVRAVDFGERKIVRLATDAARYDIPAGAGALELVSPDGKTGWTPDLREYVVVVKDKIPGRVPNERDPEYLHPALLSGSDLVYRNLDEISNYSNNPVWLKYKGRAPKGLCAFLVDGCPVPYNKAIGGPADGGYRIVQAGYMAPGKEWTFRLRQLGGECCKFPRTAMFGGVSLCEAAVFEKPLSEAERAAVAAYLTDKWLVGEKTLPVIPRVKSWKPDGTQVWRAKGALAVTAQGGADASAVARQLKEDWALANLAATDRVQKVSLSLDPASGLAKEGYRLTLDAEGAKAVAATRQGLYWATRTLLQCARSGEEIACGTVEDEPDYPERGLMLDVGRKFFPMSFLRAVAKDLAYYKMNTFHVHLNDDIVNGDMWYWAFRLESRVPGLTARDGSYTKDEFRQFIRDCAKIGVNVIPEFDAPGHANAFSRVWPELILARGWDQLDTTHPDVFRRIRDVWAEYLEGDDPVFCGPDVHAGTDEYCRGSIEGYRAFTDSLFRYLLGKGKKVHAWGSFSACTGKTAIVSSPDITIDLWHHRSYIPEKAIADGYSVANVAGSFLYIVPGASYYRDYVNEREIISRWSPAMGDGSHPIAVTPQLKGGKFAIWNDLIANGITADDVFDRLYPAMRAVAEKTWFAKSDAWAGYARRRPLVGEAPGVDLLDANPGGAPVEANPRERRTGIVGGDNPREPRAAIGWSEEGGWTVSFTLRYAGKSETLFDDGTSQVKVFANGDFGFSRDGYDVMYDFVPEKDKTYAIVMTGTPKGTALYVDGKLVKDYGPEPVMYPHARGGRGFSFYRTLHFPLLKAPGSCSRVSAVKAVPGVRASAVRPSF